MSDPSWVIRRSFIGQRSTVNPWEALGPLMGQYCKPMGPHGIGGGTAAVVSHVFQSMRATRPIDHHISWHS